MTVVQRFGSAMQLMPHFHTVGFDGVFSVPEGTDLAVPRRLPTPTDGDIGHLVERVHQRVPQLLRRRGLLPDEAGADSHFELNP